MATFDGLIKLYEKAVIDVLNIRYCGPASMIVIHEYFTTLDQEIELVWKSRWSLGKVLFFINRYYILFFELVFYDYGIFSQKITDEFCLRWFRWATGSGIATFAIAQSILQLRLYALYGKRKLILALMIASFVAALAAASTVLGITLARVNVSSHLIPRLPFCIPTGDFHVIWAFWIPFLGSDCFLCGLAVYKGAQIHSLQGTLFRSRNRLVEFFIRDSVLYFLVVFAIYLGNTLVFIFVEGALWECTAMFMIVTTSVLVNRLILNVRGMLQSNSTNPVVNMACIPTLLSTVQSQPQFSENLKMPLERDGGIAVTQGITEDDHCENRVIDIRNPQVGYVSRPGSQHACTDIEAGGQE